MKKLFAIVMTLAFMAAINADAATKGSKRVGGSNSHGKGSHYVKKK